MSFAALELMRYLLRSLQTVEIAFSSEVPERKLFIKLQILDKSSRNDKFLLEPQQGGIVITGYGRTGLLYGAYEFLHIAVLLGLNGAEKIAPCFRRMPP